MNETPRNENKFLDRGMACIVNMRPVTKLDLAEPIEFFSNTNKIY